MKTQLSPAARRQRKFLLVLPLLVLPFMTMAFWALGGGKGREKAVSGPHPGLDTRLPEARFSDQEKQDKFSVYETLAKRLDSADPGSRSLSFNASGSMAERHEERINERLDRIRAEMDKPADPAPVKAMPRQRPSPGLDQDVSRLEGLIRQIQSPAEAAPDPELRQLDAVLEKILAVQDAAGNRAKGKPETRSSGNVHRVAVADSAGAGDAVRAVIHQDQTVTSGSVIRIRLQDSIRVGATLVPRNELIYGQVTVDGERLKVSVSSLRYGNAILPVSLQAFDLDGLEGLYSPGALTREAVKDGADDALRELRFTTLDPSVSAQVAGAGLQAAKGLFRKKARLIKVKVKAGYQLLLRDRNQRI